MSKNEKEQTNEQEIDMEDIDVVKYERKVDELKQELKKLKEIKKQEKKVNKLEKEKRKIMKEMKKKHK